MGVFLTRVTSAAARLVRHNWADTGVVGILYPCENRLLCRTEEISLCRSEALANRYINIS